MALAEARRNENRRLTKAFVGGLDDDGRMILLKMRLHSGVVCCQPNGAGCPDTFCPLENIAVAGECRFDPCIFIIKVQPSRLRLSLRALLTYQVNDL
jgi:hypothetical protein